MTTRTFLDTNIFLYHLLNNHPGHSPSSTQLLWAIAAGEKRGYWSSTVVFEVVHVLETRAMVNRADIAMSVSTLLRMHGLESDHSQALLNALDFWKDQPALSFADCIHLAQSHELGMDSIYTFDRKMNRYPGVTRIEP